MNHNSLIAIVNTPAYGDFKENALGQKLWRPLECHCGYEGTFEEADRHYCDGVRYSATRHAERWVTRFIKLIWGDGDV